MSAEEYTRGLMAMALSDRGDAVLADIHDHPLVARQARYLFRAERGYHVI
jgi:hypothetical protein